MATTLQLDQLATPTDLDEWGKETVADGLRRLVVNLFARYVKTQTTTGT